MKLSVILPDSLAVHLANVAISPTRDENRFRYANVETREVSFESLELPDRWQWDAVKQNCGTSKPPFCAIPQAYKQGLQFCKDIGVTVCSLHTFDRAIWVNTLIASICFDCSSRHVEFEVRRIGKDGRDDGQTTPHIVRDITQDFFQRVEILLEQCLVASGQTFRTLFGQIRAMLIDAYRKDIIPGLRTAGTLSKTPLMWLLEQQKRRDLEAAIYKSKVIAKWPLLSEKRCSDPETSDWAKAMAISRVEELAKYIWNGNQSETAFPASPFPTESLSPSVQDSSEAQDLKVTMCDFERDVLCSSVRQRLCRSKSDEEPVFVVGTSSNKTSGKDWRLDFLLPPAIRTLTSTAQGEEHHDITTVERSLSRCLESIRVLEGISEKMLLEAKALVEVPAKEGDVTIEQGENIEKEKNTVTSRSSKKQMQTVEVGRLSRPGLLPPNSSLRRRCMNKTKLKRAKEEEKREEHDEELYESKGQADEEAEEDEDQYRGEPAQRHSNKPRRSRAAAYSTHNRKMLQRMPSKSSSTPRVMLPGKPTVNRKSASRKSNSEKVDFPRLVHHSKPTLQRHTTCLVFNDFESDNVVKMDAVTVHDISSGEMVLVEAAEDWATNPYDSGFEHGCDLDLHLFDEESGGTLKAEAENSVSRFEWVSFASRVEGAENSVEAAQHDLVTYSYTIHRDDCVFQSGVVNRSLDSQNARDPVESSEASYVESLVAAPIECGLTALSTLACILRPAEESESLEDNDSGMPEVDTQALRSSAPTQAPASPDLDSSVPRSATIPSLKWKATTLDGTVSGVGKHSLLPPQQCRSLPKRQRTT